MAKPPLNSEAQKHVLEVTKQVIALAVFALGFLSTMLFTTFKGTPFVPSAMTSLFAFLLAALLGVLTQLAVVAEASGDTTRLEVNYVRLLLHLTWLSFVVALVAFVVFTTANLKQAF